MDRRAPVHGSTRGCDLFEHDRRFGDALTAAGELLGDRDTHPSAVGERVVEIPRELVSFVLLRPVLVGEVGADPADALADRLVMLRMPELHHRSVTTSGAMPPSLAALRCRVRW